VLLRKAAVLCVAMLLMSASADRASTFTVESTADSGGTCPGNALSATCTLRQAILDANATVNSPDDIVFKFAASSTTITPLSALPAITDRIHIVGGGKIELDGASAGANATGLTLSGVGGEPKHHRGFGHRSLRWRRDRRHQRELHRHPKLQDRY
jgi:CSLREA domain-containing protein